MAYGNIYYAGWHSDSKQGYLYIDKRDYVGSASELTLKRDGFAISTNWQFPILGVTAEFSIMNLETDFFTLLPLLSGKEMEYKVRIETTVPSSVSLFEGFLNCDTITQKYLHRKSINFVASSYISKLEDVHPSSIDILQNITFISVVNEILRQTGADFNIRINTVLRAEGDTLTAGHTLFDKCGFFTELFWKDNVERNTSLEILKSILASFNCYLYWFDKHWYIERYEEIWNTSIDYVEYTDAQCIASSAGSVVTVTQTVLNVHDLVFTDTSQTLAIIPGVKTCTITLNDSRLTNLLKVDTLKDCTLINTGVPDPPYRTWRSWSEDGFFMDFGLPKSSITNSIHRHFIPTNEPLDDWGLERGVYSTFKITVDDETTMLSIKFKFAFNPGAWKDLNFVFHYYIRSGGDYLTKSTDGDGNETWFLSDKATELEALQSLEVSGSDFDRVNQVIEASIDIPIGKTQKIVLNLNQGLLVGDQLFTICFASEQIYQGAVADGVLCISPGVHSFVGDVWYGDFNITTTGTEQENIIEGVVEENFLNKEEVSLDLYDMESYNYKNGILKGTDLLTRTERWGTLAGTNVINERGVCYATHSSPDLTDGHTHNSSGFGAFSSFISGLAGNTLYHVRAYATDGDGNTTYGNELDLTTLNMVVGTRYQGGKIGYIFLPSRTIDGITYPADPGYVEGEIHGIIVENYEYPDGIYLCSASGATVKDIGGGIPNTAAIIADNPVNGITWIIHYNTIEYEGFNDWYLPSINELLVLYNNRLLIGGYASKIYWSSTIVGSNSNYGYVVDFGSNAPATDFIYGSYRIDHRFHIRAVRNF